MPLDAPNFYAYSHGGPMPLRKMLPGSIPDRVLVPGSRHAPEEPRNDPPDGARPSDPVRADANYLMIRKT